MTKVEQADDATTHYQYDILGRSKQVTSPPLADGTSVVNKMDFDHQEVGAALRDIGASEHAAVLESAMNEMATSEEIDFPQTAEDYLSSAKENDLKTFDEAFSACKRPIEDYLEYYLDRHESEFIEWSP